MTSLIAEYFLTTAAVVFAYLSLAPPRSPRTDAFLASMAVLFAILAVRW